MSDHTFNQPSRITGKRPQKRVWPSMFTETRVLATFQYTNHELKVFSCRKYHNLNVSFSWPWSVCLYFLEKMLKASRKWLYLGHLFALFAPLPWFQCAMVLAKWTPNCSSFAWQLADRPWWAQFHLGKFHKICLYTRPQFHNNRPLLGNCGMVWGKLVKMQSAF